MNAERKTPKKHPKVPMRVFFVALVLKFQSVISAERTNTFQPKNPSKWNLQNSPEMC